jgi:hypothetical protein
MITQREDRIRTYATAIFEQIKCHHHVIYLPADVSEIDGIPIEDYDKALILLEKLGLIQGGIITFKDRILWYVRLADKLRWNRLRYGLSK